MFSVPLTNMKVQRKKQALEESDLSTFGHVGMVSLECLYDIQIEVFRKR